MRQFKPAIDYLPHESPMVLVETVIDVSENSAECEVIVSKNGVLAPFINQNDALPAWFAIEMMAQTIGVWCGWHAMRQNRQPKLGLLLGSRAFKTTLSEFPLNARLNVYVNLLLRDDKLANFDCHIKQNGDIVTTAKLNVYEPDENEITQLIKQGSAL